MLHRFYKPYERSFIYTNTMPTEREYDKHNPEIKDDKSLFKPYWLRQASLSLRHNYITVWLMPGSCWVCWSIRMSISILAIVGLYSLIF